MGEHLNETAYMARRSLTSRRDSNRFAVAREAGRIAEAAQRIADDVDNAIACGKVSSLAQDVQQLLIRATQLRAETEALEIFDVAFPAEGEKE
ncbi:hypothetical protein ACFW2V_13215 [Streptomyces sp. NPDC058947]|uniref:hypothetical protein n=1 Tax=Streptomyces sp. NPDC058947 TaxID=3346675 RepID=UPI00367BBB16